MSDWFTANKDGLRQIHERLVDRRGFGMIGGELYQNVADTDATFCKMNIEKVPGRPRVIITVEDDGHGFKDLTHAWTMFAPSEKKNDPTKAGRFNLGEKVVLSFADNAEIYTTTGTVIFDESGRHEKPRRKRKSGTVFTASISCNQERYEQLIAYMRSIIVRPGLKLTVNGEEIFNRSPIHQFNYPLQTEIGDDLRKSTRITEVQVYEVSGDEVAMLYELGIPVVETGDRWHYNIQQKVPLNVDRDNVPPAFLNSVRVAVFNEMHKKIEDEDTTSTWIKEASSDSRCSNEAAETLRVKQYGQKSVAFDPTNQEANAEAVAHGYVLIPPRGLSPGQRENLKRAGTLLSSSNVFPNAGKNAYGGGGELVRFIEESNWTRGMKKIHYYTKECAYLLMDVNLKVEFVNVDIPVGNWNACYCKDSASLHYNIFTLGRKWFEKGVNQKVDELMIHEFAHQYCGNHLSEDYYDALCMLGAKLKELAMKDPLWFKQFYLSETPA